MSQTDKEAIIITKKFYGIFNRLVGIQDKENSRDFLLSIKRMAKHIDQ